MAAVLCISLIKWKRFLKSDDITILRDGQWVVTRSLQGMEMDQIISLMVGRELTQRFPTRQHEPQEVS